MDKEYQGTLVGLRAIGPKKKPVRGSLTISKEENNNEISTDRIIVERFFGRF